jgi:hypothetical protein
LSDDYILPLTLIELYATCHLWTNNMTSCKHVVSLRVLYKFGNFDSNRAVVVVIVVVVGFITIYVLSARETTCLHDVMLFVHKWHVAYSSISVSGNI